ncbi:MAG TPA: hypothetical protein VJV96_17125 [Candidatus Angelobacter sp.]|jgi:hypothetical protein|nr:hypothetical protein [Candidatus Angelobacter sp.]
MDLKTWFKGLAVFVASSLITSVAASSLDPSAFNLSRAGLARVGALAAVIGAKAVYLYMKQSPLPGGNPAVDWTKIMRVFAVALLLPLLMTTSGCYNSWEQSTYATLAAGKAVIDCAVAGYNHFDADIRHACSANPDDPSFVPANFYLPQTREAQQAIEKARQVQTACVEAFAGYAVAKVAKDSSASIVEKQAAVDSYLAQLPALLDAVRSFLPQTVKPAGSAAAAGTQVDEGSPERSGSGAQMEKPQHPLSGLLMPSTTGKIAVDTRADSDWLKAVRALAADRARLAVPQNSKTALPVEVQLGQ